MNEDKMYTIYKITNNINGKIYVGAHVTNNINDDYMGSGKCILSAISKYGKENFTKEILCIFNNVEDMYFMESIIVNDEFLKRKDIYNLKEGGYGGWDHQNSNSEIQKIKNKKSQEKQKILREQNPNFMENVKKSASETFKRMHKEGKIRYDTFTGKKHTKETKLKIGIANSIRQQGKNNSNYGKCWIYSDEEKKSMCVEKEEIMKWINIGWKKGRKILW